MPSAEGFFQKVGNDPLYASEVNRFVGGGYFVGMAGSRSTATGDNTGVTIMPLGSAVISAGSVQNPSQFLVTGYFTETLGDNKNAIRVEISGLSANGLIIIGSANSGDVFFKGNIIAGSPLKGMMYFNADVNINTTDSNDFAVNTGRTSTTPITNLYLGSTFVIKFSAVPSGISNVILNSWAIQAFGRGY
jgi:hypothetical protein